MATRRRILTPAAKRALANQPTEEDLRAARQAEQAELMALEQQAIEGELEALVKRTQELLRSATSAEAQNLSDALDTWRDVPQFHDEFEDGEDEDEEWEADDDPDYTSDNDAESAPNFSAERLVANSTTVRMYNPHDLQKLSRYRLLAVARRLSTTVRNRHYIAPTNVECIRIDIIHMQNEYRR
jgi:hypothetical protein